MLNSLTFGFRRVSGDAIEDVDEDEEERDEERHAARNDVGRHHEADPRYHNKQSWNIRDLFVITYDLVFTVLPMTLVLGIVQN